MMISRFNIIRFLSVLFTGLLISILTQGSLSAECTKCERIREENKNLPPLKHEFYDDYLQDLDSDGKDVSDEIDFMDGSQDTNR